MSGRSQRAIPRKRIASSGALADSCGTTHKRDTNRQTNSTIRRTANDTKTRDAGFSAKEQETATANPNFGLRCDIGSKRFNCALRKSRVPHFVLECFARTVQIKAFRGSGELANEPNDQPILRPIEVRYHFFGQRNGVLLL